MPLTNQTRFVLDRFAGVGPEETFAIGDVHGQAALLDMALDAIAAIPPAEGRTRRLVTLGDYVDRGEASVRALDLVMGAQERLGFPVTPLLGNHEQMLSLAMSDDIPGDQRGRMASLWTMNGGISVIEELAEMGHDVSGPTIGQVAAGLGPARIAFLQGLARSFRPEGGDVLFVHAGLHPRVPSAEFLAREWRRTMAAGRFDEAQDPCWIRGPFLGHRPSEFGAVGHDGLFVVHGHTPQDGSLPLAWHVARDRVNLDGYAYSTGRLRVARLVGNVLETFEVTAAEGEA